MTTIEIHNWTLYGEPVLDDGDFCDKHGCRVSHNLFGGHCPDCLMEIREHEQEQNRIEAESQQDEMMNQEMMEREPCIVTHFKGGGVAFTCKMPWWA